VEWKRRENVDHILRKRERERRGGVCGCLFLLVSDRRGEKQRETLRPKRKKWDYIMPFATYV
jgi:hypothetical protein